MTVSDVQCMRDGEPWFVAKDACDCLEITNVSQACQILDDDEKDVGKADTLGGSQAMTLILRCDGMNW